MVSPACSGQDFARGLLHGVRRGLGWENSAGAAAQLRRKARLTQQQQREEPVGMAWLRPGIVPRHSSAEQPARSGLAWSQLSAWLPKGDGKRLGRGGKEGEVPFEQWQRESSEGEAC